VSEEGRRKGKTCPTGVNEPSMGDRYKIGRVWNAQKETLTIKKSEEGRGFCENSGTPSSITNMVVGLLNDVGVGRETLGERIA